MTKLLLLFGLPFLTVWLTRKRPVGQMATWTVGVQLLLYFGYIVVSPIAYHLSWGIPAAEALSPLTVISWWSGDGVMGLSIIALSALEPIFLVIFATNRRQRRQTQDDPR